MKICVIGYSGAGKSTLAEILGEKFNLPVLHLDATFWFGDWQQRTRAEQTVIVKSFMDENPDGWIIDGNYQKICPERLVSCDRLYFLNYNRFFCFKEAFKRYKKYKGAVRPDLPCKEKFDFEFARWLIYKGRTVKCKKTFKNNIKNCRGEVFVFKNRRKLNEYLSKEYGGNNINRTASQG